MKLIYKLTGWMISIWLLSSCTRTKTIQYLQTGSDSAKIHLVNMPEATLQKGDLLSITVYSDNPAASAIYNQPVAAQSTDAQTPMAGTTGSFLNGYLIDDAGNIHMPGIGPVYVEGKTKKVLAKVLADEYMKRGLLTNASCEIRFKNFKVTLMGEVAKPGVYSIPSERVTIFEAIGLAGDMTNFGKKQHVKVMREIDGKREIGQVDLAHADIFNSPYYFLRQNDVVFVEQDNRKVQVTDMNVTSRNVTIITSLLSATAVIVALFLK